MKTILPGLLSGPLALLLGCGPSVPPDTPPSETDESGIRRVEAADLGFPVGDYLPPLQGGWLEVAAPAGWDWRRPSDDKHLVGFVLAGESNLNALPRILLDVEQAAGYSMTTVDEATLLDLLREVRGELPEDRLDGDVRALLVNGRPCIAYVTFARSGNAIVRRQIVQTLVEGRMVTARLEAFDRVFPKYRNAAFAVIASLRFGESGSAAEATAFGVEGGAASKLEQP